MLKNMKYMYRILFCFLTIIKIQNCFKFFQKKKLNEAKVHVEKCSEYTDVPLEFVKYERVIRDNGKIYYNFWHKIHKNISTKNIIVSLSSCVDIEIILYLFDLFERIFICS